MLQAWSEKHVQLLLRKLTELSIKHTICLIAGEKHVTDILNEGRKMVGYSMVCSYGKTEKNVDIIQKPSQGYYCKKI